MMNIKKKIPFHWKGMADILPYDLFISDKKQSIEPLERTFEDILLSGQLESGDRSSSRPHLNQLNLKQLLNKSTMTHNGYPQLDPRLGAVLSIITTYLLQDIRPLNWISLATSIALTLGSVYSTK